VDCLRVSTALYDYTASVYDGNGVGTATLPVTLHSNACDVVDLLYHP
jgi:hypothetical protein